MKKAEGVKTPVFSGLVAGPLPENCSQVGTMFEDATGRRWELTFRRDVSSFSQGCVECTLVPEDGRDDAVKVKLKYVK